MMPAKLATIDLLKIKGFWYKDYDVIISVYNAAKIILSRGSNHIVNVVMWPKFSNSYKFLSKRSKNNDIFEIFKMFKINLWINFTTRKVNVFK